VSSDFYSYEEPSAGAYVLELEARMDRLKAVSREKKNELKELQEEIAHSDLDDLEPLENELEKVKDKIANMDRYNDAIKGVLVSLLSNMMSRDVRRFFRELSIRPIGDIDFPRRNKSEHLSVKLMLSNNKIVEVAIPNFETGFTEYLRYGRR
jgi:transposase